MITSLLGNHHARPQGKLEDRAQLQAMTGYVAHVTVGRMHA